MGKGDKRTKRGKISSGSFGKTRPKRDRNRISSQAANIVKGGQEEE